MIEQLHFLDNKTATNIARKYGTPTFVYSETVLRAKAQEILDINAPYGQTTRYAMKANPSRRILEIFRSMGVVIDASSGFEVWRALRAGYKASDISLATQEWPDDIAELADRGVQINVCSLQQLEAWGTLRPGSDVGVRINPGIGSGHSHHTNVGGVTSSFGIWHEYIDRIQAITAKHNLRIVRIHTHIGAGVDPAAWEKAMHISLGFVEQFPDVATLDLGGGFKVARISTEHATNIAQVGELLRKTLTNFAAKTGRKLHLELEPGTYMTANSGSLITTVTDIVDTGDDGYTFLKIDAGMDTFMRPVLYGSQHSIVVITEQSARKNYIVVGHCCESGDLLTPAYGKPGELEPRTLVQASTNDLLVIEGVGAYVTALKARGYNSFPSAAEVLLRQNGELVPMRNRETLDDLLAGEL